MNRWVGRSPRRRGPEGQSGPPGGTRTQAGVQQLGVIGGRTRTRTLDPLIKSQLLYQLSYAPAKGAPYSNPRPP